MAGTPIIGNVIDWQDPFHGSFELTDVTKVATSDGDSGETMFNVNQQPIGAKQARGSSTVTFTQTKTIENTNLPNWRRLKRNKTQCLLTITEMGAGNVQGARRALTVVVSKVDDGMDNQGEATNEVELTIVGENDQ